MKKVMAILLGLVMLFGLVGCGNTEKTNPDDGEKPSLTKLATPLVTLNEDTGVASWSAVPNASGYAYKINDGAETATSETSVTLSENQTLVVKAVGNGTEYSDSNWSGEVLLEGPYSYVLGNQGAETSGLNIYTLDGEYALETMWGDKAHGDVLQPNTKYVLEFDAALGTYKSPLLFCGVENAKISDVLWSDCTYDDRDGESTLADKLLEVPYLNHKIQDVEYGSLHRLNWGNYWGLATYGWNPSAAAKQTDGVYDTSAEGFWTEKPNECGCFFGEHWLATEKTSAQVGERTYVRMTVEFASFDEIMGPDKAWSDTIGDMLGGKTGFNMYAFLNAAHYYAFLTGYKPAPIAGATQSYAVNEVGEESTGVNIYDAETGELVLDSMTAAGKGEVLALDKDYVFEFKVNGDTNTPLLFTGIGNSVVKNVMWSDKLYSEGTDEEAIADSLYSVNFMDGNSAQQALYHRLMWDATNNKYTYKAGAQIPDGARLSDYSGDYGNECPSFNKMNHFATGKTTGETGKTYFRMTVSFYKFLHIGSGAIVTDKESDNYGKFTALDANMFVHHAGGNYSLYLANALPEIDDTEVEEE